MSIDPVNATGIQLVSALRSGTVVLEPDWFWFREPPSNKRRASMRPRIILFGEGEDYMNWRQRVDLRELGAAARKQVIPGIKAFCQISANLHFEPLDKFAASSWIGGNSEKSLWVPNDPALPPTHRVSRKIQVENTIPFIVKYHMPKEGTRLHTTMPYFMLFGKVQFKRV